MGAFSPDAGCTLPTSLVGYWKLDETSGTRVDSIGSSDLADNNTVGNATGKVSNAAQFIAANSEYLSVADNAALSMGDIDFTIACWVYLDSGSGADGLVTKWNSAGVSQKSYMIWYESSISRFEFLVSSNGSDAITVTASNFGAPSLSNWYHILAWHDSVNNNINISVNNGTPNSTSHSLGVFDNTSPFQLGALQAGTGFFFDGRIDEVGVWKKLLSSQEKSDLYNSGSGNTYDPSGTCSPAVSGLGNFMNLFE